MLLNHCRGIGRRTVWRLIQSDPALRHLNSYSINDWLTKYGVPPKHAQLFIKDFNSMNPIDLAHQYEHHHIVPIPFHHPSYPKRLKTISDPPYLLYAKGDLTLLNSYKALSVVGTRHPSIEANHVMHEVLTPLVEQGWVIISGMAMGIDGMAHRIAENGKTIAVLGSGLLHPYPAQHHTLFSQLCKNQLVISEYPPSARPERWRFPERNRIISGLGLGTLVIEAKEKSGSLITADQALDQGREVFAIPGSILKDNSSGTNRLIQQGAKLVCHWHDIIDEFSLPFGELFNKA
nr:DNA-processing protein DprA [Sporolactobacillus kofuensis]